MIVPTPSTTESSIVPESSATSSSSHITTIDNAPSTPVLEDSDSMPSALLHRNHLVEVEHEYFVYRSEENNGLRAMGFGSSPRTFARTCHEIVRASAHMEWEAQIQAEATTIVSECKTCGHAYEEKRQTTALTVDQPVSWLFRHFDRVGCLVQQLVNLTTVPFSILGDFCLSTIGNHGSRSAEDLLKRRYTLFDLLPFRSWPKNPGIPPFAIINGDVFSPNPFPRMRLFRGNSPEHPTVVKFQVPQWFIEAGGWHSLTRLAQILPDEIPF